jgi:tyrosyl-tRNA synthetase
VVLDALRAFQDDGHTVVLIVGDYTAMIGDPSGRSDTRPMLTREQVDENARTHFDQVYRVLDRERTGVRVNGERVGLDHVLRDGDVLQAGKRNVVRVRIAESSAATI